MKKNIYFLSDFHLGYPNHAASIAREKKVIRFLESIRDKAKEIFIVGDMFEFWHEYRFVVPKGHVRLLGKIAELTDTGTPVHFFVGNHDMWMKNYFQQELNVPVYFEPKEFVFDNKHVLIAHGDGLGPGDHSYKLMKKIFRNPVCQWLFSILPPAIGIGLANFSSQKSREATGESHASFLGEEKEWLITYCKDVLKKKHYDYFVFGHRHVPVDFTLGDTHYINLGDWITHFTYAVFDGDKMELKKYEE